MITSAILFLIRLPKKLYVKFKNLFRYLFIPDTKKSNQSNRSVRK